jgi:hypothetical protein
MNLTGNHCQCTGCGEYFNSVYAFDKHRAGGYSTPTSRRCRPPAELVARGWGKNAAGWWITSIKPNVALLASPKRASQPLPATTLPTHPLLTEKTA